MVYQAQGKYAEAEELYIQALNIREKEHETDDPKVAAVCRNIANLYKQIGKEDQAERLEARARRIRSNQ